MASWNNFMGPLIYVNDERLYNLAFGLFKFNLTSATNPSLIMAGSFIMTLPIIALFFLFQRYFIQGISLTGLGGR
jgi:multiple sugar transport system permease protein